MSVIGPYYYNHILLLNEVQMLSPSNAVVLHLPGRDLAWQMQYIFYLYHRLYHYVQHFCYHFFLVVIITIVITIISGSSSSRRCMIICNSFIITIIFIRVYNIVILIVTFLEIHSSTMICVRQINVFVTKVNCSVFIPFPFIRCRCHQ